MNWKSTVPFPKRSNVLVVVPRLLIPAVSGGDVLYHGKNAIDERRAVLMHMRACVCVRVMRGTQPRRVSE